MKLGVIKKINAEDLKGDADAKITALVDTINPFIEAVVNALQGRLTLADNFYCKEVSLTFTSGTAQRLPSGGKAVLGYLPVYCGGKTLTKQKFEKNSDGSVQLTLTFDETGSANCRLYLFLG